MRNYLLLIFLVTMAGCGETENKKILPTPKYFAGIPTANNKFEPEGFGIGFGKGAGMNITTESYFVIVDDKGVSDTFPRNDFIWYVDYSSTGLREYPNFVTCLKMFEANGDYKDTTILKRGIVSKILNEALSMDRMGDTMNYLK